MESAVAESMARIKALQDELERNKKPVVYKERDPNKPIVEGIYEDDEDEEEEMRRQFEEQERMWGDGAAGSGGGGADGNDSAADTNTENDTNNTNKTQTKDATAPTPAPVAAATANPDPTTATATASTTTTAPPTTVRTGSSDSTNNETFVHNMVRRDSVLNNNSLNRARLLMQHAPESVQDWTAENIIEWLTELQNKLSTHAEIFQSKGWTATETELWLTELNNNFSLYKSKFLSAKLTGMELSKLTEKDLISKFNINTAYHRLAMISNLKNRGTIIQQ